jgi:hypothetical protein
MELRIAIGERMRSLTRREKALVIITGTALALFAMATAMKPAMAEYAQRRSSITFLESEKERIGGPLAGMAGLEKKLEAERGRNTFLRERVSELSERLKSADGAQAGGLDFLQSIVNGANLSVAEINISSEPLKTADVSNAERYVPAPGPAPVKTARVDDEPLIIRSRIVLRAQTGFRELTALVNRIESARLPLVMRKLDVAPDTPGHPHVLKMEIEMDMFSL